MPQSTILLVEDEDLLREGIQEILEASGFRVVSAADGIEALQCLEREAVSLVISDLVMPRMTGLEFVQQVRQKHPVLPIVIVSGSLGAVMKRMGIESIQVPGATASIMKPFKSSELIALVRQVLDASIA